jgi:hypothetical protein
MLNFDVGCSLSSADTGGALQPPFEYLPSLLHLERAIVITEQTIATTPEDCPNLAVHLNTLSVLLHDRYPIIRAFCSLEEAIVIVREDVAATLTGDPDRILFLKIQSLDSMIDFRERATLRHSQH